VGAVPDAPVPHATTAHGPGAAPPRSDGGADADDAPATPAAGDRGDPGDRHREPVRPGTVLAGRYELHSLLASGGMAEVWEGLDQVLQRRVAVKVLHPHLGADEAFRLRFRSEAVAAARLRHPSIIAIFDTCHDRGTEAIVMELLHGRTLREFLDERGRLDPPEVVDIGADVAAALQTAHTAGVIHRDIKPANILLCDDGRVVVTDFGIAKVRDTADLTTTGIMLGTVKYLAPEQVASEAVDPRTDQYALGVVLYEALCGTPPFMGDSAAATALARMHRDPPRPAASRPDVPPALDAVIVRAMARHPDDRFPSAADLRAALLATTRRPPDAPPAGAHDLTVAGAPPVDLTVAGPAPTATPTAPHPPGAAPPRAAPTRAPRPRRWIVPLIVGAVAATALVVAALLLTRTQAGDDLLDAVEPRPAVDGPVQVVAAQAFDPIGGDGENDELAPAAADGDPATAWRTERYDTRSFGNLKPGVGIAVQLDRRVDLASLVARSPNRDWAAQVYVADSPSTTLEGWGDPVAAAIDIDGDATFALDDATGRWVLLWITDLGEGTGRVEIQEIIPRA
jgi:eukaryotic-like serine/threonine-protein kinase